MTLSEDEYGYIELHDQRWNKMSLMEKLRAVYVKEDGILRASALLRQSEQLWPLLAVLYSTIDTCAYLDMPNGSNEVRPQHYRAWVDAYFNCTAMNVTSQEFYGARCGVLHTRTGIKEYAVTPSPLQLG